MAEIKKTDSPIYLQGCEEAPGKLMCVAMGIVIVARNYVFVNIY